MQRIDLRVDPASAEAHYGAARADSALSREERMRAAARRAAEGRAALEAGGAALARADADGAYQSFYQAFLDYEGAFTSDPENAAALARFLETFTGRDGRAGPREWLGGAPPEGEQDLPGSRRPGRCSRGRSGSRSSRATSSSRIRGITACASCAAR